MSEMGGRGASGRSSSPRAATPTTPTAPVGPVAAENRIRQAYDKIAPRERAWMSITDVRRQAEKDGLTGAALDQAMRDLARRPDVAVMGEANQKTLTVADRRNAIRLGGQENHLISIGHAPVESAAVLDARARFERAKRGRT